MGSVCFGLVFAKLRGVDLRAVGSGNVGATNAGRAMGKLVGLLVLLLDALKGLLPVLAARHVLELDLWIICAIAVAAPFGHCFPIWHRFRGGKAAATTVGALLGLMPMLGGLAALTFIVVKKLSRRASVASLSAVWLAALIQAYLSPLHAPDTMAALALAGLVTLRHRSNIVRLIAGTEPKS